MSSIEESRAEARALIYFIDALLDKNASTVLLNSGQYPATLFHLEQLCEKSSKACFAINSILITEEVGADIPLIKGHLFSEIMKLYIIPDSGDLQGQFRKAIPYLRKIESYYISTRYEVNSNGSIRLEEYDGESVKKLYDESLIYLELCFKFVEQKYGKQIPRDFDGLKNFFKANYIGFVTK